MSKDETAAGAPREQGRFHSRRKMEAVLRVLRGETLDAVSRDVGVTGSRLAEWRDEFLLGGQVALRSRGADPKEEASKLLHQKIGEITMENELLRERARRAETGHPFASRRSKT
jgi:hypothetical protein